MSRRFWLIAMLAMAMAFFVAATVDTGHEDQGPEHIDIDSGGKGLVSFPHREHQNNLTDCNICHQYFPMEQDAILRLKKDGQLKKKQIMKDLCIHCHKETKQAGKDAGPTSCNNCHTG